MNYPGERLRVLGDAKTIADVLWSLRLVADVVPSPLDAFPPGKPAITAPHLQSQRSTANTTLTVHSATTYRKTDMQRY